MYIDRFYFTICDSHFSGSRRRSNLFIFFFTVQDKQFWETQLYVMHSLKIQHNCPFFVPKSNNANMSQGLFYFHAMFWLLSMNSDIPVYCIRNLASCLLYLFIYVVRELWSKCSILYLRAIHLKTFLIKVYTLSSHN